MNALEIKDLSKKFGSQTVIDHLSLSVPEHSVFGFLGQNGAGKTTTMKMILGLLKADQGEIRVFEETVSYGQTKTNRNIGYLPDVPEFYNYMKPMEYLDLCGTITGLSKEQTKKKSLELLHLVGLDNKNKRIGSFSRGMKQRLGIAQALLNEPKLLICDEPTSALDPIGRKEILDILIQVKNKTTVIFSTHILSDVEHICDSIAILHKGKLALNGTIEEIKANYKKDSLMIEFSNKKELERFMHITELSQIISRSQCMNHQIIIHTADIKKTELLILELLVKYALLPTKLEILEPELENLFMEVVQ